MDTAILPLHTMIADLYCVRWILSLIISDISSTTNAFFFTTHHPSNYFRAHHVPTPSSDRRPHHDACIQRQCNMILFIASDNIDNIDNNNSDDVNIDDSGDNSGTDNTIESDDVETDTSEEEQLTILNPNSSEYTNAAQTAENDFLIAMLQQTSNFQQIKKERGGDVAIEEFMDLIQQSDEEEARRLAESEDGDNNLVDDDDMQKIDAEVQNDTGDNSWQ